MRGTVPGSRFGAASGGLSRLVLLAGLSACPRNDPPPTPAMPDAAPGVASADASVPEAAVALAVDPPEGPSLYFAKVGSLGSSRFYFTRAGSRLSGFYIGTDRWDRPDPFRAELLGEHRFRLTSKLLHGVKVGGSIVIEGTFQPGHGLAGVYRFPEGQPEVVSPEAAEPLGTDERSFEVSYAGSLGDHIRLRAKLRADGADVHGVYRYTSSRTDLHLDGTVDASTRRLTLSETNAAGTVTGAFDGFVVTPRALAGQWRSPPQGDGGVHAFPFMLTEGAAYPSIVELPGGGRVVPQETYRASKDGRCERSYVYPQLQLERAGDAGAEKTLNGELELLAHQGPTGGRPTHEELVAAKTAPIDCSEGSTAEASYVVLPLTKALVAFEVSHYFQEADSRGLGWSDCGIANLDEGRIVSLAELLDDGGRAKLSALVAKSIRKDGIPTGLTADDVTAYSTVVASTPLCLQADGVRVSIIGHPAYGPQPQVIPTRTVAALLPEGNIKDALAR